MDLGAPDAAGEMLLQQARGLVEAWLEAGSSAIAAVTPERVEDFEYYSATIKSAVIRSDRSAGPPASTVAGVRDEVVKAIDEQRGIVDNLPSAVAASELLIAPDTNALIADPDMGDWMIGSDPATVVIVPEVIRELDLLKLDRAVKPKAEGVIRRFKELERRGGTLKGVTLAENVKFREIAVPADLSKAPRLLEPTQNADDRILASVVELSRRELASRVVLVTRDRLVRVKARQLRLVAVDVADL